MHFKNISKLMFFLVLGFAVVFPCTPAMGWIYPQPTGTPCTADKEAAHICFNAYIDTTGFVLEIWPDPSGNWPIEAGGIKEFRYKATPIGKPPAWNYIALGHKMCNYDPNKIGAPSYILDYSSPGAQLNKDTFFASCPSAPALDEDIVLIKLNPTKTKTYWTFSIFTTAETGVTCSMPVGIILPTSSGSCRVGFLNGPLGLGLDTPLDPEDGCPPDQNMPYPLGYNNPSGTFFGRQLDITLGPCGYAKVQIQGADACVIPNQPFFCFPDESGNIDYTNCHEAEASGEKGLPCPFETSKMVGGEPLKLLQVLYGSTLYGELPAGYTCDELY